MTGISCFVGLFPVVVVVVVVVVSFFFFFFFLSFFFFFFFCLFFFFDMRAATSENVPSDMFAQRGVRPACAFSQ